MTGVYMIINKITNEVYVGSATDIKKRWSTHLTYLRQGTYKYEALQQAFDDETIGWEILEECREEEKIEREDYWFEMAKKIGYKVLNKRDTATTHKVADVSLMRLAQTGSSNGNARLTEKDVMEILWLRENGYKPNEIAERYNINKQYVFNIGKTRWQHIDEMCKPDWVEVI